MVLTERAAFRRGQRSIPSAFQKLIEDWWNVSPEMRFVEMLCGENKRICIRLHELSDDDFEEKMVGQAECGSLVDAFECALNDTRCRSAVEHVNR